MATSEKLSLTLTPVPKVTQLFSLATPLRIKGSFSDFGVSVRPEALIGTAFVFYTSPIEAPLSWIFGRNPPKDGSDVCVDPLAR